MRIGVFFFRLMSSLLSGAYWKFKLLLFAILLALIVSPPSKENIRFGDNESYWPAVEQQVSDPLQPIEAHPKSHVANKAFRLTVPLIGKVLNLQRKGIYLLQVLSIFVTLFSIITISFRVTSDKILTAFFLISLVPLYPVICAYQETSGHLDAFAYCFLLLAMTMRTPVTIFFFSTCASWCDERAFVATSFIFVWWYIQNFKPMYSSDRKITLLLDKRSLAVVLSGIFYLLVRGILMNVTPLSIAMEEPDFTILPQYIHLIPMLFFLSFGGLWILFIMALYILLRSNNYLYFCLIGLLFSLIFSISCVVWDFTRSIAFLLPVFFISLYILAGSLRYQNLRLTLFFIAILALIIPCYHFDSQLNYLPGIGYKIAELIVYKLY